MEKQRDDDLRSQVALAWVMVLVTIVLMFVVMVIESILANTDNFMLRVDPGPSMRWMVYKFALYALMPIYVSIVHGWRSRIGRWVGVALAALSFAFYLLHHLAHWQYGQRPTLSSHAIDIAMHLVGLWLLDRSIRWARSPRSEPA